MEMTLSDGSVQTFEVIVQYVCVPTSAIRFLFTSGIENINIFSLQVGPPWVICIVHGFRPETEFFYFGKKGYHR